MGKKAKLILKGISEESGQPFKREIRTLDEVRESGQYTLVGYNVSEDEGLPPAEYDDCNYCFIEALLSVTRNSSTSGVVKKETIGQTITISNREDGGTNIYNRSWSMGKNNEEWTPWLMIATGNMQLIAQNNDVVKAYTEVSENLDATLERIEKAEDSISKNNEKVLEYATVRFDRIEENVTIINAGEADSVKEVVYYKPSNIFVAADSSGAYWDTWSGRDAYMRENAIYENKLYICGNQSYIWDGTMLCDVSKKVITLLQAEISRANKAEQLILQLMNNIKPVEYSGTVFNSPDEEDITQVDNALKLKDRAWGDGMGYVILRKNKPLQEQLTEENTIYEVRYDFDLNGEEITMPLNSVLKFVGGKFSNGAICGGNVFISAIDQLGIFNNCILKGNFKADIAYSYWFNISKVEDNTSILNSLLNIIATRVEFAKYDFPIVVSVNSDKTSSIVLSIGNKEIDFNYNVIKMSPNNYEKYNCIEIKAENLSIKNLIQIGDIENHTGDAGEWGHGICLRHCKNIIVDNCTFSYNWGDGIDLIDTYYGDACPENIKILNTKCLYNRRQGISVEAVKTLHVENCEFAETGRVKATAPSSGIDIEPWQNTDNSRIKDVIIKSCRIYNNVGQNIQIQCNTRFEDKDYTNDIRLENNTIYDDYKDEVIVLKDIVNLKILGNFLGNDNHYFSITLFQNKNIQILNNIIKGNVYIQASNKATITYNHIFSERAFEEISPWGHLSPLNCVDCNNFIVSNNDFKSLKYAGIKCTTATENTIYSNRISGVDKIEVSGQITLFSNIIDTNHIHLIKEDCMVHSKDNIITNKGISEFCVIIDCYERVDDKYSYTSINDVFHGYTYCFGFYRPGGRVYMENLQNIKAEIYGGYEDYWDFRNVTIEFESHITSTVNGKNRFDFDGQPIGTARYGDIIHRPSLSKVNYGLIYNDWDIYRPIFNINGKWRTADGIIAPDEPYNPVERTVSRPKSLDENNKGLQFFDIDLSKPIWWTGTKWIDATGTEV